MAMLESAETQIAGLWGSDGVNGGIHTRSSTGSQGERGEDEASQVPKAGEGRRKGPDRGAQTPGASRGRRGRRTDPSVSVRDQDHPNSTSAARPGAQSAGSGQDVRALLLDHGHVDFGHAEDSDQPLERTIHARLMHDHTQGSPAHESMVGNGGKAHQVRTGRSGNQGDGGERPFPGSTKSLGLHSVEPAGEEGTGHGSTASVIGRAEGGDQDAQGSSHDGGGHPRVCPDAEAGGKHHSSGSGLHAGADDKSQGREGPHGNDEARQLGSDVSDWPTPATGKAAAQSSGESSSRTEVVGSSGAPHCQMSKDLSMGTWRNKSGRSEAPEMSEPGAGIAQGVGEMRTQTITRLRSPHGQAAHSVIGDLAGEASLHRETSEDRDADIGEGARHRGVPMKLRASQQAKKNGEHQDKSTAPAQTRPGVPNTQTTLPWQAPRREHVIDSVPPAYCLLNRSNYCYLNLVAVSLHWAMDSAGGQAREYGSLRTAMAVLTRMKAVELATQAAWKALLQGWRRPAQQHDVTELMSFVMGQSSRLVVGEWQARCVEQGHDTVCDRGSTAPFIGLDIQGKYSLREALESWHAQHYKHALSMPPTLLAIQLGPGTMGGEPSKYALLVTSHPCLKFPSSVMISSCVVGEPIACVVA